MNWFIIIGYYGYVNKCRERARSKKLRRMKSIDCHIEWKLTQTNASICGQMRAKKEEKEPNEWASDLVSDDAIKNIAIDKNELNWLVLLEFYSRKFYFYHRIRCKWDCSCDWVIHGAFAVQSATKARIWFHWKLFLFINVHVNRKYFLRTCLKQVVKGQITHNIISLIVLDFLIAFDARFDVEKMKRFHTSKRISYKF